MDFFTYNTTNLSSGSSFQNLFDPFSHSIGGFNGVKQSGSVLFDSLVLDNVKGEHFNSPPPRATAPGKKGGSEARAVAALKNHSEAERRRRERINSHLATLRGLVPVTEKMDKATLLAEVISQVKELKKKATEATNGFIIPMDNDEVKVEPYYKDPANSSLSFKVTICCDFRPQLLSDLKQALNALQVKIVKAEISTLGCRVMNIFVLNRCNIEEGNIQSDKTCQLLVEYINRAVSSVLEKDSLSAPEYSPRTTLLSKRQRISFVDSSSSSSGS